MVNIAIFVSYARHSQTSFDSAVWFLHSLIETAVIFHGFLRICAFRLPIPGDSDRVRAGNLAYNLGKAFDASWLFRPQNYDIFLFFRGDGCFFEQKMRKKILFCFVKYIFMSQYLPSKV